ncbi:MAG: alpha/beta hydrolase, partial [Bdellovibrionales bacterium]|nr:alpha/beta hydrolase [Bdellovibrionales bacterium]
IWGEEVFNEKSELLLGYREKATDVPAHVVRGLIGGGLETKINLSEIDCPVLLLAGKEDLLTPPFLHEKMLTKLKYGKLEITPGGHASLIEKPAIMEHFIIPWIENLR